jgi:hypothetical protein
VVETELFAGRHWRSVTSVDGVAARVASLSARALRQNGEKT